MTNLLHWLSLTLLTSRAETTPGCCTLTSPGSAPSPGGRSRWTRAGATRAVAWPSTSPGTWIYPSELENYSINFLLTIMSLFSASQGSPTPRPQCPPEGLQRRSPCWAGRGSWTPPGRRRRVPGVLYVTCYMSRVTCYMSRVTIMTIM